MINQKNLNSGLMAYSVEDIEDLEERHKIPLEKREFMEGAIYG